jgi:hypothetical protein
MDFISCVDSDNGKHPHHLASNSRHSPGTPFSLCIPLSRKWRPESVISFLTESETSTSFAAAIAAIRAPTWTVSPMN